MKEKNHLILVRWLLVILLIYLYLFLTSAIPTGKMLA